MPKDERDGEELRRFELLVEHAKQEESSKTIDPFYMGACGLFFGGLAGAFSFCLLVLLYATGGSPVGFLLELLIVTLICAGLGALIFPVLVRKLLSVFRK